MVYGENEFFFNFKITVLRSNNSCAGCSQSLSESFEQKTSIKIFYGEHLNECNYSNKYLLTVKCDKFVFEYGTISCVNETYSTHCKRNVQYVQYTPHCKRNVQYVLYTLYNKRNVETYSTCSTYCKGNVQYLYML